MIKIGGDLLPKEASYEKNLTQIRQYLQEHQMLIVNDEEMPLSEDEIVRVLQTQEEVYFKVIPVKRFELEMLKETEQFLEHAEEELNDIVTNEETEKYMNAFLQISESLLELAPLVLYFGLELKINDKVKHYSQKALNQLELGNEEYIGELLEYEILPLLNEMKQIIKQRIDQAHGENRTDFI